jgi:chromosome segregation ATPase
MTEQTPQDVRLARIEDQISELARFTLESSQREEIARRESRQDMAEFRKFMAESRQDMSELKESMTELKGSMTELKGSMTELKESMTELRVSMTEFRISVETSMTEFRMSVEAGNDRLDRRLDNLAATTERQAETVNNLVNIVKTLLPGQQGL